MSLSIPEQAEIQTLVSRLKAIQSIRGNPVGVHQLVRGTTHAFAVKRIPGPEYCLTEDQFEEITAIELGLVNIFTEDYGDNDLDDFGSMSYQGALSSIMFDYWGSYLNVKSMVERVNGDIYKVFKLYNRWHDQGRETSLVQYFEDNLK